MNDFDLIIFDCDGTLTDSEYVNNQALVDVLHEEGLQQYTFDYAIRHWVGTTNSGILTSVEMETGKKLPDDILVRVMRRGAVLQDGHLKPIEGALEFVAASQKIFKICVASNGERSTVLRSLEKSGLMAHFTEDSVFTKNDVKYPKPYPDLFLFAAAKMGAVPARSLVIEDSATGVRAGVAAGMTTWGFSGSSHDPAKAQETLKSAGATLVFSRLIHMKEKLGL